jgi:hypothetical protein
LDHVDLGYKNLKIQLQELVFIKNSKHVQIFSPWKVHFPALTLVKLKGST